MLNIELKKADRDIHCQCCKKLIPINHSYYHISFDIKYVDLCEDCRSELQNIKNS